MRQKVKKDGIKNKGGKKDMMRSDRIIKEMNELLEF